MKAAPLVSVGIPVACIPQGCPSTAKQQCSALQHWSCSSQPPSASMPPKPSHALKLNPSPGSFSPAISIEKLERSPAHLGAFTSSSLSRKLSDGGQVLNFCVLEPHAVQSKVNRFLQPEGVSWSPHLTSGITQARDRRCNYTTFLVSSRNESTQPIPNCPANQIIPWVPKFLTLSNFPEVSL